ncbi:alpha/beta fold hydrolase [Nocardia fluminea]|uniref:alpha/beta fold hydrolase n=1 Tax=Nocardia fluminea TaxID=134984 RepID=UPI0037145F3C
MQLAVGSCAESLRLEIYPIDKKRVLIWGLVLFTVANALMVFVDVFWIAVVLRVLAGLAAAAASPTAMAIAGGAAPHGQPGLSADQRPRRNRMPWYGRMLADVLDQTVTKPVLLIGHSLGAGIAMSCPSRRIGARLLLAPAGLVRLSITPDLIRRTVPWMLRPDQQATRNLLALFVSSGHTSPDHMIEWMTLVAQHCRTSLAPPPLPPSTLKSLKGRQLIIATGQYDCFLPPRRLRPAADRMLHSPLTPHPSPSSRMPDISSPTNSLARSSASSMTCTREAATPNNPDPWANDRNSGLRHHGIDVRGDRRRGRSFPIDVLLGRADQLELLGSGVVAPVLR